MYLRLHEKRIRSQKGVMDYSENAGIDLEKKIYIFDRQTQL